MDTRLVERNGQSFLECVPSEQHIESERDALDLVGDCLAYGVSRLLLFEASLPDDFYDLKTGLAGGILQKFVNYNIRVAAVISAERIGTGRFSEMVLETNRGSQFRVFDTRGAAERWLLGN